MRQPADDLYSYAGKKIGSMIGTADACVISSASAGIALAVASLICGGSLQKVKHLYDTMPFTPKREVILLKGQNLANRLGIPCIVDAAAEEDLKCYAAMVPDFVCYSRAKAIEGPASGFAACKTSETANHMRLQYKGIGRTMNVGKECTMGLLKAIGEYLAGEKKY